MKRLLFMLMLIPLFGIAQKNVVTANRVFPKVDKVLEFEKALATHAQKYHTGDWKWRVYEISSGPDAGGYHIAEGPDSWEQLDTRGNLGDEHNNDWNKNVTIYLTDRGSSSYSVYQDSLSTVALGSYSDKIQISHWFPKIGWANKTRDLLRMMRATWMVTNENIAVYASSGSGPTQYSIVTRYKTGLKERAMVPGSPSFKENFEKANGSNSWDTYLEILRNYVESSWSELLMYRADLSSK